MPSWRVHRRYAHQFLRERGLDAGRRAAAVGRLIDLLIDAPQATLKLLKEELLKENKVLALMLTDSKLKPFEPVGQHDWGAWRCCLPSIEAARRVGEMIAGRTGRLLVDLHLSLDYVWRGRGEDAYRAWADEVGIDSSVVEFVVRNVLRGNPGGSREVYGAHHA